MTGNTLPVIVVGDMNDGPDAVTTQLLLGPPDGDPHRPDKGDDVRLYNLSDQIPQDHRYSRIFNGQKELIDHILLSRESCSAFNRWTLTHVALPRSQQTPPYGPTLSSRITRRCTLAFKLP